ncbi:MAG: YlxR family protein [Cyanobacteria bacterium HKST-UBA04]|nr:YlxR family protein [Cyanobacteria bacterium HKST-UBA04]MCA9842434.1 YlxR family protein [Cyanobacteria bacterium HKST-UBA03]
MAKPSHAGHREYQPRPVERRCLVCRTLKPRQQMLRLLKQARPGQPAACAASDPARLHIWWPGQPLLSRHLYGRSFYICYTPQCLEAAQKGKRLAKALKATMDDVMLESLSFASKGCV